MSNDNYVDLLEKLEGYSDKMYKDEKGIPTIGYGSNLNSPEVPAMLDKLGLDRDSIMAGEPQEKAKLRQLMDMQLADKRKYFDDIRSRKFAERELASGQDAALRSLHYNNPQLLGPNLLKAVSEGDDLAAAKEILLRSNRAKSPGIAKRRAVEAQTYAGDDWQDLLENISPEEIEEVAKLFEQVKNPHTRQQLMDQFPGISKYAPSTRFKKLK